MYVFQAIELSPEYLKAYLRRAKCYMELEQYEEAVRDYQKVFSSFLQCFLLLL